MGTWRIGSLGASKRPATVAGTETARLATSCHAGAHVNPRCNITVTGAAKGKMLGATRAGFSG
jgi:hypothetical protein